MSAAPAPIVIVAGHLLVDPAHRDEYLVGSAVVVEEARRAPGCLDFALSADVVDPGRINVYERWESQAAVEAFRGSGPDAEASPPLVGASVSEYDVSDVRVLSGDDRD